MICPLMNLARELALGAAGEGGYVTDLVDRQWQVTGVMG
jgi:hypothetical protein